MVNCGTQQRLATKATLHLDLTNRAGFLPDYILRKVRENSRHLTKNDEIVIQADDSRKQPQNVEECFNRLHKILLSCVAKDVPGATSAEQKKRVAGLYVLRGTA
jgi:peptidyl-tRNA hydrolase ICT1